jgi:hypothetical protein
MRSQDADPYFRPKTETVACRNRNSTHDFLCLTAGGGQSVEPVQAVIQRERAVSKAMKISKPNPFIIGVNFATRNR